MDCKKALTECGGDFEEAVVWLRKKGIASADKKASRIAAEGAIGAYIHGGSRLGVIVEVNCETDFVARGDRFKELVNDITMQTAACMDIEYVSPEDADPAMIAAEKDVQMKMEDMLSKPENIREKIVQGRLDKMVNEKALLKQDFIKDTSKTVEDIIKEATSARAWRSARRTSPPRLRPRPRLSRRRPRRRRRRLPSPPSPSPPRTSRLSETSPVPA